MGKFDGILIATDLDGTLVSEGKISKENSEAIRYFQSEGGIFTLATGRYADHISENFSKDIEPNTCLMTLNGNILYDLKAKKKLKVCTMDSVVTKEILDFAIEKFPNEISFVNICNEDESYKYENTLTDNPCKCVFVLTDENSAIALRDILRKHYSHVCNVERSWPVGVEIYNKDSGKGLAVKYIRENINPDVTTLICVGDYENDVSMLKIADIGYAVANATTEAMDAADFVTDVDNHHHAIAWIINKLDKEGLNL